MSIDAKLTVDKIEAIYAMWNDNLSLEVSGLDLPSSIPLEQIIEQYGEKEILEVTYDVDIIDYVIKENLWEEVVDQCGHENVLDYMDECTVIHWLKSKGYNI